MQTIVFVLQNTTDEKCDIEMMRQTKCGL